MPDFQDEMPEGLTRRERKAFDIDLRTIHTQRRLAALKGWRPRYMRATVADNGRPTWVEVYLDDAGEVVPEHSHWIR